MIVPGIEDTITLLPGDRLFQPVADLLILAAAVGHATSSLSNFTARRGGTFVSETRYYGRAVMLPMDGPFELALEGRVPERIDVGLGSFTLPKAQPAVSTRGLNRAVTLVIKLIFLGFFDRYNAWLNENLGEASRWPMTLNFARVVRNAAAHDGIAIRSRAATPVFWKGLCYSHADNGNVVFGSDLQTGDVLGLMFDVCDELDILGAPLPPLV